MSSRRRSARRAERRAAPRESPQLAQARAELQRVIDGSTPETETLFDRIARCDDFLKASNALGHAIRCSAAATQRGRTLALTDRVLPGPGALLPP